MIARLGCCTLVVLALSGCTRIQPGLGFDSVAADVESRTGKQTYWNRGGDGDRAIRARVDEMLQGELSADAAVQVALLNNPMLQATYQELDIAQADVVQATRLRNPVFSGDVRFATGSATGTGVALDVSQEFVSILLMPRREALANAAFESAKVRVTSEILDLALRTRLAWIDSVGAQALAVELRAALDVAEASHELTVRLRQAGNVRELDVLESKSQVERAKLALATAEEEADLARERLGELMGTWTGMPWATPTTLPEPPAEPIDLSTVERRAVANSLDLERSRRDVEIAARSLGITEPFAAFPEFETGVASERELEGDWSVGPSWSVGIPIFDQGDAAVGAARARLRQADEQWRSVAIHVRGTARSAAVAAEWKRRRAVFLRDEVGPTREQITRETLLLYNAMQVAPMRLLEVRRDEAEARADRVTSTRDYWKAQATLDAVAGGHSGIETPVAGGTR